MKPNTTRSLLWLVSALACASVAIGVHEAGKALDPTPALAATLVAQVVLAVAGALVFATRSRAPAAHTRARWDALEGLRALVTGILVCFLAGLLVAAFLGAPLGHPGVQLALLAPAGGALLCIVGAVLDQERFVRARRGAATAVPPASSARKVYETRTGAVLVEEHDGKREVVLTGPGGRRDVTAIEREIDGRGWREGETPSPAELNSALRRWGVLRGNAD